MSKLRFTIFTATFNRKYMIENLYRSLQRQTFKNFEWIVIDDGSTDNTEQLFNTWKKENNFFDIIYIKVENGGKHRAINRGLVLAKGELFFIVDSDDYLTDNSLEIVDAVANTIPDAQRSKFVGVCGQKGYSINEPMGKTFVGEYKDMTFWQRLDFGLVGDKAEVFYTEKLKEYPFPEFDDENFILESVVWNRMANDGLKLRYFNKIVYICDYLPDGLTKNINDMHAKNPKGYALHIYERIKYKRLKCKTKRALLFNYYCCCRRNLSFNEISNNLKMGPVRLWVDIFWLRFYYRFINR